MKMFCGILCCILLCSPMVYAAPPSPQQDLAKALKGKSVLLRGMESDDKLNFDTRGTALKTYEVGSFACSGMNIEKVRQSKTKLEIEGTRAVLIFDTTSQSPSIGDIRSTAVKARINITIAIDPANPDALKPAILKVLAFTIKDALAGRTSDEVNTDLATIGSLAAPLNAPTLAQAKAQRTMPPVLTAGAYSGGKGITPPRIINSVDPNFPPAEKHIQGTCVITMRAEANGLPSHIRVRESLRHDYEVAVIATVSQFRFKPAIYQGKPVPAWINVTFRLY